MIRCITIAKAKPMTSSTGHRDHHDDHGVERVLPEQRVGQDRDVVAESDEALVVGRRQAVAEQRQGTGPCSMGYAVTSTIMIRAGATSFWPSRFSATDRSLGPVGEVLVASLGIVVAVTAASFRSGRRG
jgi:hypothetical protein